MLFSEIYGSYYNAVAEILKEAVDGNLTQQNMRDIITRKAFGESMLSIPDALEKGEWPLLTEGYETPLNHEPKMPLTDLQKRWMKALLNDPRIRLFDVPEDGLDDVRPLYEPGSIVYFDQYSDGDPYEDEKYIKTFRTILQAIREKRKLHIKFKSGKGKYHKWECIPKRLDYSLKDDKFRLIIHGVKRINIINVSRIIKCSLLDEFDPSEAISDEVEKKHLIMELRDERNALERAMLHFSHLEKETLKLDDDRYRIELVYSQDDETELLIRVLSFGPMLKVLEPDNFIRNIRKRLEMQKRFM